MAPPQFPDDLVERLRVHISTLYHGTLGRRLLERFGRAADVLRQPRPVLRSFPGMSPGVLERLASRETEKLAWAEVRRAADAGVRFLCWGEPDYPLLLKGLEDVPPVIYLRGSVGVLSPPAAEEPRDPDPPAAGLPVLGGQAALLTARWPPAVGIVGSRHPTPYGILQARRFAVALARRGFTVVSGLAAGIDGEAHRASLEAGGATVGVLGCGLTRVYPRQHADLIRRIVESGRGAVLTEFPFLTPPRSFHFPLRNRILSGLSDAVLIVEAGERSGSLITARHALEQGRPIYVVPGRVGPEALGGLRLIADGAYPALGPEDILPGCILPSAVGRVGAGLGSGPPEDCSVGSPASLDGPYGARLEELFREEDAWHPDLLVERLGDRASHILAELTRLEMEGLLERLPGGCFVKRVTG